MVRIITVTRKDDLGSAGEAETVKLSLNGRTVHVDLNKRNRETLERHLDKYFEAGEVQNDSDSEASDIRTWAERAGLEIGRRGRIPDAVKSAYRAAN